MMMALATGMLVGGPAAAVAGGYADKAAAADARDQVRKDAKLAETARMQEKSKALAQLNVGAAAGDG